VGLSRGSAKFLMLPYELQFCSITRELVDEFSLNLVYKLLYLILIQYSTFSFSAISSTDVTNGKFCEVGWR
jgi:hypothetical protein